MNRTLAFFQSLEAKYWRYTKLVLGLLFLVLLIMRRPDAILNAQFWAEDGTYWYSEAYNQGWFTALLQPENGYFQTISRLGGALAQLVPLALAPLLMNSIAILVEIAPALFLLSRRLSHLIPSRATRALLAYIYIMLPHSAEVHANITNAHWDLAILAFMVVVAKLPQRRLVRMLDIFILALCSVSGPFGIALLPITGLYWLARPSFARFINLVILGIGALIQIVSILTTSEATRSQQPLGATPELFLQLIGSGITGGLLSGRMLDEYFYPSILLGILTIFILIYALFKARLELKLFALFGIILTAAALASPMASFIMPQWQALLIGGLRYWYIPMIVLSAVFVWLASRGPRRLDGLLGMALVGAILFIGIPLGYQQPAYTDYKFQEQAAVFEAAEPGTTVTFPLNPAGFSMTLIKR